MRHARKLVGSERPGLAPAGAGGALAWSLAVGLSLALSLGAARMAPAQVSDEVSANVSKVLQSATPKNATVGVQLVALGDSAGERRVLFARSADRAMIPASNLKLLTTAAALDTLGKDFVFRTQLLIRRNEAGEVELAVIGDGDPSFGDATLLKDADGWGTRTVFASWASALKEHGVTRIDAMFLDDSVFDDQHVNPNWPLNQRHRWYEAPVGGLNLNINCLDVYLTRGSGELMSYRLDPPTDYVTVTNTCRRGTQNSVVLTRSEGTNAIMLGGQTNAAEQGPIAVTVHGPTDFFGTVFAEVLREAGIECDAPVIDRSVRQAWKAQQNAGDSAASSATRWQLLAVHQTPMPPVLARTNKNSINLYAEALAKRMAHAATGEPGSWAAAEQIVKAYLQRIGLEADHVRLDDGSGMSREDRASAAALCDVLAALHYSDAAQMFRDSLSEAGVDGTLQKRFGAADRRDLHGRVFGKTGYINGVCTFSGYLHGRDGKWYAFSILVNDCANLAAAQQMQEQVIVALDRSLAPAAATAGAR